MTPSDAADSLGRFRRTVATALAELESRRQEVNDLNVFPVADGDTGDNMTLTLRSVLDELDRMNGQPLDDVGRDEVVQAVARAALLGARGNSGVILSQIVRGAAEELASRPGELIDPVLVSAALARAADAAYDSVRDPAEGTMLSAIRAMAHRVAHDLAHMERTRLDESATPQEQDMLLAEVLDGALEAAREALERGPEQLPVLREAGVVDAGAYGVTVIIAGTIAALRGEPPPELPHEVAPDRGLHLPEHESSEYRYCTNFAVTGEGLERQHFVGALEAIGDSVLVVGDPRTLRVHVHTDEPEAAVALFEPGGQVSRLDVADMHEQIAARSARIEAAGAAEARPEQTCGAVVVASGAGLVRIYEGLGARVVDGGPTLNPSTYDLLAGIHAASAREVVVLPNSPNVILAAERAADLSEKPARVVPTRSQQAGLATLVTLDPAQPAADNVATLEHALADLRTGGVAVSAREDPQGRFASGDALGYDGEDLIAWGEPASTLATTVAALGEGRELLTCIAGEGAPLDAAAIEALLPDGLELDHHEGGQSSWWWLLCAE